MPGLDQNFMKSEWADHAVLATVQKPIMETGSHATHQGTLIQPQSLSQECSQSSTVVLSQLAGTHPWPSGDRVDLLHASWYPLKRKSERKKKGKEEEKEENTGGDLIKPPPIILTREEHWGHHGNSPALLHRVTPADQSWSLMRLAQHNWLLTDQLGMRYVRELGQWQATDNIPPPQVGTEDGSVWILVTWCHWVKYIILETFQAMRGRKFAPLTIMNNETAGHGFNDHHLQHSCDWNSQCNPWQTPLEGEKKRKKPGSLQKFLICTTKAENWERKDLNLENLGYIGKWKTT